MRALSVTTVCATLAIANCMGVASANPVRTDFAYGIEITDACAAVCELTVPITMYQRTAFSDLRDVRVFNADGEVVPHALRAQTQPAGAERVISLPLFPLRGDVESALKYVQVQISAAGEHVALRTQQSAGEAQPVVAYLIDARSATRPLSTLELQWSAAASQFSIPVTVEASDDLRSWRTVVSDAPLVNLQFGGEALIERDVDLPQVKAKFLRLQWTGSAVRGAPFELQSVKARVQDEHVALLLESLEIAGTAGNDGEYLFDVGGHVPAREVNVLLPQINTIAEIALSSRVTPSDEWRRVRSATLYRLSNEGREVRNRALPTINSDRYWKIQVATKGGGIGSGVPRLMLTWEPQRLLFVARGKAPFLIAFGHNRATQDEAGFDALLGDGTASTGLVRPRSVQPGKLIELGGAEQLNIKEPTDWKRWLLWSVLLIGVALLIGMARRLLRETQAQ